MGEIKVLNIVTTQSSFFESQVRALERQGVECETISLPGTARERTPIEYLRTYPRVLSRSLDGFDVIHANYGTMAPFALFQPKRPIVLSLWGSDLMGDKSELSKFFGKYCDEVIVMSDEMEAKLPYEAHVIPHGVDLERFQPRPQEEARQTVGWETETKHVLFPYDPKRTVKNYPLAEQVVEDADRRMDRDIELHVLYGADHSEVPIYMNAADALILTSDREGSPNTVKEALACNLPIVATDVGDVSERISRVEPSNVCQNKSELVSSLVEVLRSGERSNGRENVHEISLDQMGTDIKNIYERAINGKAGNTV